MQCPRCGGSGEIDEQQPLRRRNYEGSVYQRKSDGRWYASLMVNGMRKTASAREEGLAYRKLAAMQAELGLVRRRPRGQARAR